MDIKSVYKQLTNVDIDEQKTLWDERGKGYYGEYILFCELHRFLEGTGKILMNLNVPVDHSNTTEIDLVLIHETGLYVFEIKHYTGTIYGKSTDATWTQYFKTVKNNTFKSPVEQNEYHIKALRKLFPDIPIHSCIVFTSDDCSLRVQNLHTNIDICQLREVKRALDCRFAKYENPIWSMQDIDSVFNQLSKYSQMQECVSIEGKEESFLSWVQPTIDKLEDEKQAVVKIKNEWQNNIAEQKKTKIKGFILNGVIAVVCVVLSILVSWNVIQTNNNEIAEFKQKFLHVDAFGDEYSDYLNAYTEVSNISLSSVTKRIVGFTARITMNSDRYGLALTENSKYIVTLTSGQVLEYDVFGEHLQYDWSSNRIGKGIRSYGDLAVAEFAGISNTQDISYIKITGIGLFRLDAQRTIVKSNLEIELYSSQNQK